MELFAGLVAMVGLSMAVAIALLVALVALALPVFWIWMLVDAFVRHEEDYPSRSVNEKILWIVLMLVFQVSAAAYWFVVYRAARQVQDSGVGNPQTPSTQLAAAPAPPVPPSPAV